MNEEKAPIRVLIADDQSLFAYGIDMLIQSQTDLAVVGIARDGYEAIELATQTQPDIILMDIRMPRMNGIEATAKIATRTGAHSARVIILTTFQREEAVFQALKHGASAYLTKDSTPEAVLAAIRTVHQGHSLLNPSGTLDLIKEFGNTPPPKTRSLDALTPRENELFILVARGLSNAEIAATSHITETTTKTHIRSIMQKLGLASRLQIVVYAYENGILKF